MKRYLQFLPRTLAFYMLRSTNPSRNSKVIEVGTTGAIILPSAMSGEPQTHRRPSSLTESRIRLDLICMTPYHVYERANEVPKMGMIYSEALAVRAWLGHQSDKIDAHLHGLRAIMEKCGISKHEFPSSPKPEIAQQHMAFVLGRKFLLHMCGKEQTARKMFSVLAGIFCKACWCRLWIIQELALAPSVVFWYGTNGVLLTVELAILTSKLLWSFGGPLSKLLYQSNNGYGAEAVAAIENGLKQVRYRINELRWHESYRCGCKEKPLWQLIDESRAAEAKDPRDKVYGLFALLPHNIRERVTPNYHPNFTVTDCYITFAKTCFEVQGNLNLLARLSGTPLGTLKEDWATWAFDLDAPESKPKIPSNTSLNNVLTEPMGLMCPNVLGKTEPGSASDLGLESEFEISVDERLLFCRAVFVDRVGSVAEWNIGTVTNSHLPERNGPKTTAEKGKQDPRLALARVLTNSATYYFTDYPSLLDVPWATLVKQAEGLDEEESEWYKNWRETTRRMEISIGVGEMDPQDFEFGHDTPVPWDECFRSLFSKQTVGSLLQPVRSFKLHGVPLESYFYSHEEYCYDLMSFRKTVHTAAVVLWYRRLCETETGMFGSVPVGTRPGDRIAVICGCDMPVVLRPHGNYYMVIGGCFIEGMMTGEAVEGVKKGQFTVESISLC
ncbi:hypothetical protein F4677DRAFT_45519 [Hypoxylon crocopeplum]|nr:hypothetical protein F4677DRAFT_45519 [Hypoxylon crocopeplum]